MRDPYQILGVAKTASEAEIKRAYRKLAKKHHPDTSKDDPEAKERFSEATAAYDFLSDKDKRARFDRGEIDAEGNPRFAGFGGFPGGGADGSADPFRAAGGARTRTYRYSGGGGRRGGFDMNDIFSDLFTGFAQGAATAEAETPGLGGADVSVSLSVSFVEAALGARKRVTLPGGRTLEIKVPAGIADGKQIRLKGQGQRSPFGGPPGDAIVNVKVEPHPVLKPDGHDVRLELPVTLYEAVLGAKIRVPTLEGAVQLTIPAGSSGGATLRLRGRGLAKPSGGRGDQLVTLKIVLPEGGDAELETLMRRLAEERPYDVRGGIFEA